MLYPARAAAFALSVMGLFAVMLAVTGIFGMAAHRVSRRMRELGIRMALGAREAHVLFAAVGRLTVLLGVGSALGLLAAVFASRLLGRIVYQAEPGHPAVLVGAVLDDGVDRHLRLGHSGPARPGHRSVGGHAGRVRLRPSARTNPDLLEGPAGACRPFGTAFPQEAHRFVACGSRERPAQAQHADVAAPLRVALFAGFAIEGRRALLVGRETERPELVQRPQVVAA